MATGYHSLDTDALDDGSLRIADHQHLELDETTVSLSVPAMILGRDRWNTMLTLPRIPSGDLGTRKEGRE